VPVALLQELSQFGVKRYEEKNNDDPPVSGLSWLKEIADNFVSMSQNLFDTILMLGLVAITLLFSSSFHRNSSASATRPNAAG
jgi:hypothetical protein